MPSKKLLYVVVFSAIITVAILVPVLLLTRGESPTPFRILSPTNTIYESQTTEININIATPDDVDMVWYRIYEETASSWLDPSNITWTTAVNRPLGAGAVFTLHAWMNDSSGAIRTTSVTFTMIRVFLYSADFVFPSTYTVGQYQKLILQNANFSFTTGNMSIYGSLEMTNVTWSSDLTIDAHSTISGMDVNFNNQLFIHGDAIATFTNVTFSDSVEIYDNSTVSVTDAVISSFFSGYDLAKVSIYNASIYYLRMYDNSTCNATLCSLSTSFYGYGSSVTTLRNFTTSATLNLNDNCSLTLIDSNIANINQYTSLLSGNWTVDNNILSGTGSFGVPTYTIISSSYSSITTILDIYGSTKVFVNNSALDWIGQYGTSNISLYQSSIGVIRASSGQSSASIVNSTINTLDLYCNGTFYLENTTITFGVYNTYYFYQGNITGYNDTFIGAESWAYAKFNINQNVFINQFIYSYVVNNQVNLTLTNNSNFYSILLYDDANVSIYFSNFVSFNTYHNTNLTIYNSTVSFTSTGRGANVTIFNSTLNTLN
ncbi:MAG: hypothetical protein HWN66_03485, partial [Candidatus Helarchaeota archaeon]|nr:hypothetical protein [Candidatus Helarchaeota archaeon]